MRNSDQLRFFISPHLNKSNSDSDQENSSQTESDNSEYIIGIGTDYLWNLLQEADFMMYGGSGVSFIFISGNNEYNSSNIASTAQVKKEESLTSFKTG
ncbi:hypothetical protein [Melioribacter sp. OK-6-Me]|uniref:hypothetical protein n=1 Tax=unclassified Melioribacter TaxID=2627329 RepID=UPI003ED957B3